MAKVTEWAAGRRHPLRARHTWTEWMSSGGPHGRVGLRRAGLGSRRRAPHSLSGRTAAGRTEAVVSFPHKWPPTAPRAGLTSYDEPLGR